MPAFVKSGMDRLINDPELVKKAWTECTYDRAFSSDEQLAAAEEKDRLFKVCICVDGCRVHDYKQPLHT